MIDVDYQINAVQRRVGRRVFEAGEARTVVIAQTFATGVEDLWDACTNPERIPRWFLPVTGDLRLGGRYQLEGNAGGVIETCNPPHGFSATWEFGDTVSWIEVRLAAEGPERTRFELEHISRVDDHWAEFGPGAVGIGWDLTVIGLTLHLADPGTAVDPAAFAAWTSSDDGRRFMAGSSQAWCDAAIAGGTDPADARAAADRTAAAYGAA